MYINDFVYGTSVNISCICIDVNFVLVLGIYSIL